MLWIVLVGGLIALAALAYLKPQWFDNVWETTLKEAWVGLVGVVMALVEYLNSDPTWQKVVDPEYAPYAIVGMAVLGIIIRRMNVK